MRKIHISLTYLKPENMKSFGDSIKNHSISIFSDTCSLLFLSFSFGDYGSGHSTFIGFCFGWNSNMMTHL